MKVRIRENSWIARIAARKMKSSQLAIVIGKTIHLHNTSRKEFLDDKAWVNHELIHIKQYRQYGFLGFIFRYLVESVRTGYFNNRFEVEARSEESNRFLPKHFEFV